MLIPDDTFESDLQRHLEHVVTPAMRFMTAFEMLTDRLCSERRQPSRGDLEVLIDYLKSHGITSDKIGRAHV